MAVALIAIFLGFMLLGLLGSSGLLWAGAKITQISNLSYRRCILTVLANAAASVAITICFRFLPGVKPNLVTSLIELCVLLLIGFFILKEMLRATYLKAFLTDLFHSVTGVLYAVALVLVLKFFVDAFIVPTGAMAEALLGSHKTATCPQCGYVFAVNASMEAEPPPGLPPDFVAGCTCPNCRDTIMWSPPGDSTSIRAADHPALESGDRFVAMKTGYGNLERFQIVVFDYPKEPDDRGPMSKVRGPIRYIKRLIGLPGETIAIHGGKLYATAGLAYEGQPRPENAKDAWRPEFTYSNDEEAVGLFKKGKFQILRKPPEQVLALRRLVYDNDHQPKDLAGKQPPRWGSDPPWKPDDLQQPRTFAFATGPDESLAWLRYRHLLRGEETPSPITDFSGYNSGIRNGFPREQQGNWAGDLMLECTVHVDQSEGELRLELARGPDRFQLRVDLSSGDCAAVRLSTDGEKQLAKSPTDLKKPGDYFVRFANVDQRLLLWVNDALPFGDGVAYDSAALSGPTKDNDLQPASIGARRASVAVSHLTLWRDNYYTTDVIGGNETVRTMYVQPGNYLMLGDNSPESSDSRVWGLVPERLIIGPAGLIYWPPARFGRIR